MNLFLYMYVFMFSDTFFETFLQQESMKTDKGIRLRRQVKSEMGNGDKKVKNRGMAKG